MDSWVTNLVQQLGYPGVIMLMFLENVFPPIPSELIMPVSGFLVTTRQFEIYWVVLAGTAGATLGALPLYYLGRGIGERRLRRLANRHGRWLAFSCRDIDKSKAWFKRHGKRAVFFGRLIPAIRSLISIPAGLDRMNMASFLIYTALGSAIWSAILACLGYWLGSQFEQIGNYIDPITYALLGLIAAGYLYRVYRFEQGEEDHCDEEPANQ